MPKILLVIAVSLLGKQTGLLAWSHEIFKEIVTLESVVDMIGFYKLCMAKIAFATNAYKNHSAGNRTSCREIRLPNYHVTTQSTIGKAQPDPLPVHRRVGRRLFVDHIRP